MTSGYVTYNLKSSVDKLDLNRVYVTPNLSNVSVYPRYIYSKNVFPEAEYLCHSGPRDLSSNFLYGNEKFVHEDHQERFSYDNGLFFQSPPLFVGKYQTSPYCWKETDAQPPNLAPERFYKFPYTSAYFIDSKIYNEQLAHKIRALDANIRPNGSGLTQQNDWEI